IERGRGWRAGREHPRNGVWYFDGASGRIHYRACHARRRQRQQNPRADREPAERGADHRLPAHAGRRQPSMATRTSEASLTALAAPSFFSPNVSTASLVIEAVTTAPPMSMRVCGVVAPLATS